MEQTLKDNHGRIIGRMRDTGSEISLKDEHGRIVGRYRKGSDSTYDEHGRYVGRGNLLAMLLKK